MLGGDVTRHFDRERRKGDNKNSWEFHIQESRTYGQDYFVVEMSKRFFYVQHVCFHKVP